MNGYDARHIQVHTHVPVGLYTPRRVYGSSQTLVVVDCSTQQWPHLARLAYEKLSYRRGTAGRSCSWNLLQLLI